MINLQFILNLCNLYLDGKSKQVPKEDDLIDPKYSLFPEERIPEVQIYFEVTKYPVDAMV